MDGRLSTRMSDKFITPGRHTRLLHRCTQQPICVPMLISHPSTLFHCVPCCWRQRRSAKEAAGTFRDSQNLYAALSLVGELRRGCSGDRVGVQSLPTEKRLMSSVPPGGISVAVQMIGSPVGYLREKAIQQAGTPCSSSPQEQGYCTDKLALWTPTPKHLLRVLSTLLKSYPFLFPQVLSWLVLSNLLQFPGPHFLLHSSGLLLLEKDICIGLPWESIIALLHGLPPMNIFVEKPGWAWWLWAVLTWPSVDCAQLGLAGAGLPLLVARDISEQGCPYWKWILGLRLVQALKGGDELPSAGFSH